MAESKAAKEAEAKAKKAAKEAEANAAKEAKEANDALKIEGKVSEEAEMLGVTKSRLVMKGFKSKKIEEFEKERKKHLKMIAKRLANRVEKAKADAKMKPICSADITGPVIPSRPSVSNF